MNDACSGEAMAMFEDLDQAFFFNNCWGQTESHATHNARAALG